MNHTTSLFRCCRDDPPRSDLPEYCRIDFYDQRHLSCSFVDLFKYINSKTRSCKSKFLEILNKFGEISLEEPKSIFQILTTRTYELKKEGELGTAYAIEHLKSIAKLFPPPEFNFH